MRILSLLVSSLAFLATAGEAREPRRFVKHRPKKGGTSVCRWEPAEVPLIPHDAYVSADQEAHLVGLAKGISRDIRVIGNRVRRGRLQKFWRRSRKGWDMMATCLPTPNFIDVQNYVNVMNALRDGLSYLDDLTKRVKYGQMVRQAQFDLIDKNLRMIGLINEIYGDRELHPALLDYPQAIIKDLIHLLKFDVTEPLKYDPSDPVYIELVRKFRDNRINNRRHPVARD